MVKLELPEIETLRRDLEREVVGRKIKTAQVLATASTPRHRTKKSFTQPLEGAKISRADRVGLDILLNLENGSVLVVSLGEHGRILKAATKDPTDGDTVVSLTFTQGGDLRILDRDGSSAISVVDEDDLGEVLPDVAELGLDLNAKPVSWIEFGQIVKSRRVPLKVLLTDPSVFIGIGDIYSNEILFDAGLRHDRLGDELSTQEIRRLYRSVAGILHESLKYGGTSLEKRPFTDLAGKPGEYAEHLAVYDRAGELSPRSRVPIQKTSFKHQVVFYCNTQV
jgi:formamidopyrimidine-DNA glycosylase